MSEEVSMQMTPLDQMLSSEFLQILKAAVPYAPSSMQKTLSVWVKLQELRNALTLFPRTSGLQAMSVDTPAPSFADMLSDIGRFTSGETRASLENMASAVTAMQMFQAMQNENDMEE